MPIYSYRCAGCGDFDGWASLAQSGAPLACPGCGVSAPRSLRAPRLRGLDPAKRVAHETNERARHEPKRHGPGCGCCSGKAAKPKAPAAMKSQVGGRPWMISH